LAEAISSGALYESISSRFAMVREIAGELLKVDGLPVPVLAVLPCRVHGRGGENAENDDQVLGREPSAAGSPVDALKPPPLPRPGGFRFYLFRWFRQSRHGVSRRGNRINGLPTAVCTWELS